MSSSKTEKLNTREWITLQKKTEIWKAIIKGNPSISETNLDKTSGEFSLLIKSIGSSKKKSSLKKDMEVLTFNDNESAVAELKQRIDGRLGDGFKITKLENSEEKKILKENTEKDFYGSYRSSSKGFLNNLTAGDSNEDDDSGDENESILVKRNLNFDAGIEDSVQKKLKISNSKGTVKSSKKKGKSSKKKKNLTEKKQKKNLKKKLIEGSLSVQKVRNKHDPEIEKSNSLMKVEIKEAPKTPKSKVSSIISSQRHTPINVDYAEIAQYNTIPVEDYFLTENEINEIFSSKPPNYIPIDSFKGIYMERKVFEIYIKDLKNENSSKKTEKKSVYTEYYSLQIKSNIAYFEYGVIEEPSCLRYELHESYDFIESYCLVHKIKQLRTEIGFEEKREKLVYSLNENLINAIKEEGLHHFLHEKRICEDVETSYQVFKSQEKSNKTKELFKNEDRPITVNMKKKVVEPIEEVEEGKEEGGMVEEIVDGEEGMVEEVLYKDVKGDVDLRVELGQSDLDIIYDKVSHSNPLFEEEDFNGEIQGFTPGKLDLQARIRYKEEYEKGELKQYQK